MSTDSPDPTKEVVKQLHEIDRSLTMLFFLGMFIAICQFNSCLRSSFNSNIPVEVHVTNMNEAHP